MNFDLVWRRGMRICFHSCRLLVLGLLYFAPNTAAMAYSIELTEKEANIAVERYFPIEHVTPVATLKLSRPAVYFDQRSNRIGLKVSVTASMPGLLMGEGHGAIDGDLEYRQETGEFYLRDPRVRRLDIENLPAEATILLRQLLQEMTRQSLPFILVYQLNDVDLRQRMARSVLQSVTVRNRKLILELAVPGLD